MPTLRSSATARPERGLCALLATGLLLSALSNYDELLSGPETEDLPTVNAGRSGGPTRSVRYFYPNLPVESAGIETGRCTGSAILAELPEEYGSYLACHVSDQEVSGEDLNPELDEAAVDSLVQYLSTTEPIVGFASATSSLASVNPVIPPHSCGRTALRSLSNRSRPATARRSSR